MNRAYYFFIFEIVFSWIQIQIFHVVKKQMYLFFFLLRFSSSGNSMHFNADVVHACVRACIIVNLNASDLHFDASKCEDFYLYY